MDRFGSYGVTVVHPVGLGVVLICCCLILALPRRYSLIPFIFLSCFIPSQQRVVILSLDFSFLRILVIAGMIRVILKKEYEGVLWNKMDLFFMAWGVSSVVTYTLCHGSLEALVSRLGFVFEAGGLYFVCRSIINDRTIVIICIKAVAFLSVPTAIFFYVEHSTGRNLFSVFGGVPEITKIREDKLRCQGAFSHPIMAGCYWASFLPLLVSLWWQEKSSWKWVGPGSLGILSIVFFCSSSTPVLCVLLAIFGGFLYFLRNFLVIFLWLLFPLGLSLHLYMEQPIWHLICRINVVGGSTGWFRFFLIDQAIKHFFEWWFVGTPGTAHWGRGLYDVTNQYILEGVRGGFLTLLLFCAIIMIGFNYLWDIFLKQDRQGVSRALTWGLWCTLFVHAMSFWSVSYFGQIYLVWYMHLAFIASIYRFTSNDDAGAPINEKESHKVSEWKSFGLSNPGWKSKGDKGWS